MRLASKTCIDTRRRRSPNDSGDSGGCSPLSDSRLLVVVDRDADCRPPHQQRSRSFRSYPNGHFFLLDVLARRWRAADWQRSPHGVRAAFARLQSSLPPSSSMQLNSNRQPLMRANRANLCIPKFRAHACQQQKSTRRLKATVGHPPIIQYRERRRGAPRAQRFFARLAAAAALMPMFGVASSSGWLIATAAAQTGGYELKAHRRCNFELQTATCFGSRARRPQQHSRALDDDGNIHALVF